MTEALSLSLQAFPAPDKDKESLQYLIQRVNAQRGSFRNVTEQSLENEIRDTEAGGESNSQEVATDPQAEKPGDAKTKKEDVTKAREEIMKQTAQALTETSTALDFVSLVLSKHAPAAAQTTISPFLKQSVPLGSLGAEIVQAPQISELEKHNDEMMGIGWRMKSLNGAADSLLKSASRLEEEMEIEARYWEQVLAVKEKGWSLHRLPREKHTLGVRYGFAEAFVDFRDQGLAALRHDEDGNLSLERGLRWKGDRKLRVRVLDQGKPIASNVCRADTTTDDTSVEREILNARNSIYDEELHHELDREARNLVNQGVRCIDGSILLPYGTTKQIEISLIPREDQASEDLSNGKLGQDAINLVPDAIAIAFRTLLSHAHRQKLQNRSRMPPPLRENKAPRPMHALIKPVVENFQHRSQTESIKSFLDEIRKTLKVAGIRTLMERTSSPDLHQLQDIHIRTDIPAVDNLLRTLTSPPHTSWTLTFLDQSTTITVDINTALQPPHFGTTFHVATKGLAKEHISISFPQAELFTSTATVQTHLLHVLALAIQQILLSNLDSWHFAAAHDHSLMRKRAKGQGQDMVYLALSQDRLDLSWRSGQAGEQAIWTWFAEGLGAQGEKKDLVDMFKCI